MPRRRVRSARPSTRWSCGCPISCARRSFTPPPASSRPLCVPPSVARTRTCSTSTPCRGSSAARAPKDELSPARRRRIESALEVLRGQRFFADPKASPSPDAIVPFEFQFDDCASAADAFRARLPALVETVRAMAIAELEADGRYVEADHDPFFESFGEHALTPTTWRSFPTISSAFRPIATPRRRMPT